MRIVHISPNAPYNDGWGYQENLLPKYQKRLGHQVTLVVTNEFHSEEGLIVGENNDYIDSNGIRIIRRKKEYSRVPVLRRFLTDFYVKDILNEIKPDFIFFHGLISKSIYQVTQYKKKNPLCVIVQDNHLDYNIGIDTKSLKGKIMRAVYRKIYRDNDFGVTKVYGVTPWRKAYAEDFFSVPSPKTDVLIMGADDEYVDFDSKLCLRKNIRLKYKIDDSDFLIVSGGRIDSKKNIHLLMRAVNHLEKVRLIVFGNVNCEIKTEFENEISDKVKWVGFLPSEKTYELFLSADLVFFPGQHSVLWEQACACKVPCVFLRWEGMEHVNSGGNSLLIEGPITEEKIETAIISLQFTDKYYEMKKCAQSDVTDIFLYSNIAKKSIECANSVKQDKE